MPNLKKQQIVNKIVEYIEKNQSEQGKYECIEDVERFAKRIANYIIGY